MNKKIVGLALGAMIVALSFQAAAQQDGKVPRIGVLAAGERERNPQIEGFQQALREIGYTEGHNIRVEYQLAQGREGRLPELAAELVRLKVDVIVPFSHRVALIAKTATMAIPVVFAFVARSCGRRARPESGETRSEYHRSISSGSRPDRKTSGTAQGNRSQARSSGLSPKPCRTVLACLLEGSSVGIACLRNKTGFLCGR